MATAASRAQSGRRLATLETFDSRRRNFPREICCTIARNSAPSRAAVALWVGIVCAGVARVAAAPLDLTAPAAGDRATVGQPLRIAWATGIATDILTLSVVACPAANTAVRACDAIAGVANVTNNGSYSWPVPTSVDEDLFYRVVLWNVARRTQASSGAFTINPFLREVPSR
jgi:hypothetical protein